MDRILLVEPDNGTRGFLASVLTRYGYDVATAGDADTALAACSATRPDVVIAPAALPSGNGLPLTFILRTEPATRDVAVLCLARSLAAAEAETGRADTVLLRPVRVRTLVQEMAMLAARIERDQPERAARAQDMPAIADQAN